MHDWLPKALQNTRRTDNPFKYACLVFGNRDAIDRLLPLELRDRWGYPLKPIDLAEIAAFIQDNADLEGLHQRSRERGAMVEIVDALALAMLVEAQVPMFCSGQDTPPEDALIETVVRTTLNLKEPSA